MLKLKNAVYNNEKTKGKKWHLLMTVESRMQKKKDIKSEQKITELKSNIRHVFGIGGHAR